MPPLSYDMQAIEVTHMVHTL